VQRRTGTAKKKKKKNSKFEGGKKSHLPLDIEGEEKTAKNCTKIRGESGPEKKKKNLPKNQTKEILGKNLKKKNIYCRHGFGTNEPGNYCEPIDRKRRKKGEKKQGHKRKKRRTETNPRKTKCN